MNYFFFVYYKREGKKERVKQICVFEIINGLHGQYSILQDTNSWVFLKKFFTYDNKWFWCSYCNYIIGVHRSLSTIVPFSYVYIHIATYVRVDLIPIKGNSSKSILTMDPHVKKAPESVGHGPVYFD
jgi:hypothetical protein